MDGIVPNRGDDTTRRFVPLQTLGAAQLTRRSFLVGTGLLCLPGCGAAAAPTLGEIGSVASGVLMKLAQELGLDYLKDGTSWLLENGYEEIRDVVNGEEQVLYPQAPVYSAKDHGAAAFGAAANVTHTQVSDVVVLSTPTGETVSLLPRAAAGLTSCWASLRAGSDHLPAFSPSAVRSYLLPLTRATDSRPGADGSRSTSYWADEGLITITYLPGQGLGREAVRVHSLGLTWSLDLSPEMMQV